MIQNVLLWGLVIGVIHFLIIGFLYGNPVIGKIYQNAQNDPGVKKWPNQKEYMIKQFLGTQVEVYILTGSYLYLRELLSNPQSMQAALLLGGIFSGIRVFPRFWNMWIQSSYPNRLLLIEIINGMISTFVILIGLKLLPINQ